MATIGNIATWDLKPHGFENTTDSGDAYISLKRTYGDSISDVIVLGIQEGTLYSSLLTLSNLEGKGVQNVAAEFEARNGTAPDGGDPDFANIAIRAHGTNQLNGPIWTIQSDGTAVKGKTQSVEYNHGGDTFEAYFVNGLYIGNAGPL